jgi:V/A-type H+/Na+-transporting ATPase subunit D
VANQTLSKAALGEARTRLAGYRRFLPSLDLKRRQLIAERNKARARVAAMEGEREALFRAAGEAVPMLAFDAIGLDGLARLEGARYGQENVVGVILPVVEHVEVEIRAYGLLVRPHWVDRVAAMLVSALRLEVEIEVARQRVDLLDEAVKKVTQRVNLFEKVLIPRTQAHIRKIQIFLGDAERAGVVTAKLAKAKQAEAA